VGVLLATHPGSAAAVVAHAHAPPDAAEAATGSCAITAPAALTSDTTHPSMSLTLSCNARPAFAPPLSHTSLPVAPTVSATEAMAVGAASCTASQGAVSQAQLLQPPMLPCPCQPFQVDVSPLMASCARESASATLKGRHDEMQLGELTIVLLAEAEAPALDSAALAPCGVSAASSSTTGIMLIQERPGQDAE